MRITSHETILSAHLIRRSEHLCNQTQIAKQRKIAKINPAFRLERKRLNKTWESLASNFFNRQKLLKQSAKTERYNQFNQIMANQIQP